MMEDAQRLKLLYKLDEQREETISGFVLIPRGRYVRKGYG